MTTLTSCRCDNDGVIQPAASTTIFINDDKGGRVQYDLCAHCTTLLYAALPGIKPPPAPVLLQGQTA